MHQQAFVHTFAARCPRGHRPPQQHTLAELRDRNVRFYCRLCESSWHPQGADRSRALGFAEASEESFQTTPPNAA